MNAADRRIARRMYGCLNVMTGLRPTNPADVSTISKNLKLADEGARWLLYGLDHLIRGEHEAAAEYLDDAERVLGVSRA